MEKKEAVETFLISFCRRRSGRGKYNFIFFGLLSGLTLFTACSFRAGTSELQLGIWAAEHNLWDEAIFRWQKAMEKDPHSAILHNNLAVAYEKKGWWEKARAEYELALKLAPENRYIKANYRYFEENLKAAEKIEKTEEKKTRQKEEKKATRVKLPSKLFNPNPGDGLEGGFPFN